MFLPARFRFEVASEALYHFQVQNSSWDPFIKTLLRSYGGSFENYVPIREFDIAGRSNLSVQQVIEGLNQLQQMRVLSYLGQTDQPQITYLRPRMQNSELLINKRNIEERKSVYRKKMEAVFAYGEHHRCRSQMLLGYFDEEHAPKCGICDVCLDEKRQGNLPDTAGKLTDPDNSAAAGD